MERRADQVGAARVARRPWWTGCPARAARLIAETFLKPHLSAMHSLRSAVAVRRVQVRAASALWLSVCALPAAAQSQAANAPAVRLASPHISPQDVEVFVTIMLANVPAQRVQVLESTIEFRADQLTYVTARLGFAGELASAKLAVEVTSPPEPGAPGESRDAAPAPATKRLVVTVTGEKPLPSGPVVEIRFQVAPGLDANPKLPHRAKAFTPEGAGVEDLVIGPGEIRITTDETDKDRVPAIMACFYYMH